MPKRVIPLIEGGRVTLRLLERDDLPLTLSWRNRDEIRQWFLNTTVIPPDRHFAWFEKYRELENDFVFIILAKDMSNTPVGQISLYNIKWDTQIAEFGRLMIGEAWANGKGYAKEAIRMLLQYGFENLLLKEIFLEVKDGNKAAIEIYRKVGFTELSRKHNLIIMSINKNIKPKGDGSLVCKQGG